MLFNYFQLQRNLIWTVGKMGLVALIAGNLVVCNTNYVLPPIESISTADPAPVNQIYALLDAAHLAMQDLRLATPLDDNAYDRYLRVLTLEPKNLEAKQGISAIVDQYLAWAINAVHRGHYSKAEGYLHKARAIDKNHPDIAAVAMSLEAERQADSNRYDLNPQALANRSVSIQQQLESIAEQIQTVQAKVVIRAQSDADGRWIYQQLNKFTRLRVRATFELGDSPSISLKSIRNE